MSSSANLVVLMGNLTRSPELRYTPQGRAVTTLNLAVNRVYRDRDTGEQVKNTDFIPVSVWGKQAENCEKYLSKGRGVYVEGRLSLNRWEDSNGESRSRLEIIARNVQFLSGGGGETKEVVVDDQDAAESYEPGESSKKVEDINDEEVPF